MDEATKPEAQPVRPKFALLESGGYSSKKTSPRGVLVSVVLHGALIAAAVFATVETKKDRDRGRIKEEKIVFVAPNTPKPPPPAKPLPEPPKPIVKPAAPKQLYTAPKAAPPAPKFPTFEMPKAPVNVPSTLPDIDLSRKIVDDIPAGAVGQRNGEREGGKGKPGDTGTGLGEPNKAYSEFEVEETAAPAGGSPNYPSALRGAGISGQVQAEFIIGPDGRVEDGSVKILQSSHEGFANAVKDFLRRAKFRPGRVGGKGVRQVVQQAFTFKLDR